MRKMLLAFFLPLIAFAETPAIEDQWKENILKYTNIQSYLEGLFETQQECTNLKRHEDAIGKCEFRSYCQVFEGNKDKAYLYNGVDGKIPNFRLKALEDQVRLCFMQVKNGPGFNSRHPNQEKAMQSMVERQRRMLEERQELLALVASTGTQAEYLKYEMAANEISLEKLDEPQNGPMMMMPSNDELQKDVEEALTRSGAIFPDNVRKKIIENALSFNDFSVSEESDEEKLGNFSLSRNPFLDLNFAFDIKAAGSKDKVLSNQDKIKEAYERAKRIFEKTQDDIILLLKRRRQASPMQAHLYTDMIRRIRTIRYEPPPTHPQMAMMNCPGPNAFYDPTQHRFVLCPQIMEFPESGLKAIIAHELGHSIDPCTLSQPLMKLSDIKIQENSPFSLQINATDEQRESQRKQMEALGQFPLELEKPSVPDPFFGVDFFGGLESTVGQMFESYIPSVQSGGVPLIYNPTKEVVDCLSSDESLGARGSAKEQAKESLEEALSRLRESGAGNNNPQVRQILATLNNFDQIYNQVGACSFLPGKSQQQEAFSDWIAAEVIGADNKGKDEQEKMRHAFESFGFFLSVQCQYDESEAEVRANQYLKDNGCVQDESDLGAQISTIMNNSDASEGVHSHGIDRVQKVFAAHPELKKALGCSPTSGGKYCE